MKIVKNQRYREQRSILSSLEHIFDGVTGISYHLDVTKVLFTVVFLLSQFSSFSASAGRPRGEAAPDASTYEAITGDSIDDDRVLWDSFYKSKNNAFGKEAVSFLKDHLHNIKRGHAFVPAMGEGRNAIYLAKHGFVVDGNDLSDVAVEHALEEAQSQHVAIHAVVADLTESKVPENYYDLVMVSLFYMKELMPKFKAAVKKGGYLMIYEKLDNGGPKSSHVPDDFLVKSKDVKSALRDFDIKVFKEYKDHDVDVLGILAKKP